MDELLRRALKDGEVNFCEGSWEIRKAKAYKLLAEIEEAGYYDFEVRQTALGYMVVNI